MRVVRRALGGSDGRVAGADGVLRRALEGGEGDGVRHDGGEDLDAAGAAADDADAFVGDVGGGGPLGGVEEVAAEGVHAGDAGEDGLMEDADGGDEVVGGERFVGVGLHELAVLREVPGCGCDFGVELDVGAHVVL